MAKSKLFGWVMFYPWVITEAFGLPKLRKIFMLETLCHIIPYDIRSHSNCLLYNIVQQRYKAG